MEFLIHRYTIILEKKPDIKIPDIFDIYTGTLEECFYKIKQKEINLQQMYLGHLYVKNIKDIISSNDVYFDLDTITEYDILSNNAYFKNVTHSGPHYENKVDDSLFLCTSWNFPCIVNYKRTNNSLYGNLRRHRTKIFELKQFTNI